MSDECPCGSGSLLEACCEPFIEGRDAPETAEQLMRSRYTAYAMGHVGYIVSTHDPRTRRAGLRESVEKWTRSARFVGLEIIATEAGGAEDSAGLVEFEARFEEGGEPHTLRERSRFRKHRGRWVFCSGSTASAQQVTRAAPKVGRNEPCPCGSGKKYKRCCG